MKKLLLNIILSGVGLLLATSMNVGVVMLLARGSSDEVVGKFVIASGIAVPLFLLLNAHLRVWYVSRPDISIEYHDLLLFRLVVIGFSVLVISLFLLSGSFEVILLVPFWICGAGAIYEMIEASWQREMMFLKMLLFQISRTALFWCVFVLGLGFWDVESAVICAGGALIVSSILTSLTILIRQQKPCGFSTSIVKVVRRVLKESVPMAIAAGLFSLSQAAPRVLLGILDKPSSVANFYYGSFVVMLFIMAATIVGQVAAPMLREAAKSVDESVMRLICVGSIFLVFGVSLYFSWLAVCHNVIVVLFGEVDKVVFSVNQIMALYGFSIYSAWLFNHMVNALQVYRQQVGVQMISLAVIVAGIVLVSLEGLSEPKIALVMLLSGVVLLVGYFVLVVNRIKDFRRYKYDKNMDSVSA